MVAGFLRDFVHSCLQEFCLHATCNCNENQGNVNVAINSTSLNFAPPAFENAASYLNAETTFFCTNRPMPLLCLVKLGPPSTHPPRESSVSCAPPPKLHARQITQPWIIRVRSNFVQSLNA